MDSDLDLLSLRCFLAAARSLNFRAAADSMHMSPATLSQRIANLERQLGTPLFERTTRRVSLTPKGELAIPLAMDVLGRCGSFQAEMAGNETVPFSLTIATRFELGLSWLTPALDELQVARPERTLHLSFGDSDDMLQRVRSGLVDAAVTSSPNLPTGASSRDLHQEDYVFVAAPDLLARHRMNGAKDASSHVLLDIDTKRPLFHYFADTVPDAHGWKFSDLNALGTIGAIRQRLLGEHGIAVMPLYYIEQDLRRGDLVRLFEETTLRSDCFRLVWLSNHPQADEVLALSEDLRAIPLR